MGFQNAVPFVEKVLVTHELKKKIAQLPRNDWAGLLKLAHAEGFSDVTVEDLKVVLPTKFYKGYGKNPDKGWDMPEVKAAQLAKKNA